LVAPVVIRYAVDLLDAKTKQACLLKNDRLKRNMSSDPVQREIFRIMSSSANIKRNEPVPDPFQNMERMRGNEDMRNKALKKSAQII
jgi:hypothetical protein